ncbi:hypothetical protein ABN763_14620 [Spongiivirga sp. MCCC 1A20706]
MKKYVIAILACALLILAYVVEQKDIAQEQTNLHSTATVSNTIT